MFKLKKKTLIFYGTKYTKPTTNWPSISSLNIILSCLSLLGIFQPQIATQIATDEAVDEDLW